MASYVMSDIHGNSARFFHMLDILGFSSKDHLYILGDVLDRGADGVSIAQSILKSRNMTLLLGNHEYMCLQYHEATQPDDAAVLRWNRNGNQPTLNALARLSKQKKRAFLKALQALPTHLELRVGGRDFYLVHGFPADNVHDEVWLRPQLDTPCPFPEKTLLIGHTPVSGIGRSHEQENIYLSELAAQNDHVRILHASGFVDLDCLCGYPQLPASRLACLRLEDMAEFYC